MEPAHAKGQKLCGFGIPERTSYLFHKRFDLETCAGAVTLVPTGPERQDLLQSMLRDLLKPGTGENLPKCR